MQVTQHDPAPEMEKVLPDYNDLSSEAQRLVELCMPGNIYGEFQTLTMRPVTEKVSDPVWRMPEFNVVHNVTLSNGLRIAQLKNGCLLEIEYNSLRDKIHAMNEAQK